MPTIMLVEDELLYQNWWKENLKNDHPEVTIIQAQNLSEAWLRFSAQQDEIDVIVLDYYLPPNDNAPHLDNSNDFRSHVVKSGFGGVLVLTSTSSSITDELKRLAPRLPIKCAVADKLSVLRVLTEVLARLAA